jgi:alpha-1,6-mannosyltransferase
MTVHACAPAQARRTHLRLAVIGTMLIALSIVGPSLHVRYGGWVLLLIFATGGAGAMLGSQIQSADQRGTLIIILVCAALMRLALLFVEPYLSTDIYRYVWDGRVQAAGINPYRYVPGAPEVSHLRDAIIFPNINRADYAVTIYPPAAQAYFLAVTRFGETVIAMKLGLLVSEAATIAAILGIMTRQGIPMNRMAAYAWHPLPVWEIAGTGHVDVVMCALLMIGLLAFLQGRVLLSGVLVTLGALVKPTALLALPVFWRPWNWRLPLVVLLTAVAAYLPYSSVGSGVIGYLPGYLDEEGLASGRGFGALWLMERFTGPIAGAALAYVVLAALMLIGLAAAIAFRKDRSALAAIAALGWLLVIFLILASPHYPWYFLVLVPFLVLSPSTTAWALTIGSPLLYGSASGEDWMAYDVRLAGFMLATIAALANDFRGLRRGALTATAGEKS